MPAAKTAIKLPSALGFPQAEEIKELLLKAADNASIALDASEVEQLSSPCLQLLISSKKNAAEHGKDWAITSPSEAFITNARQAGLISFLELTGDE